MKRHTVFVICWAHSVCEVTSPHHCIFHRSACVCAISCTPQCTRMELNIIVILSAVAQAEASFDVPILPGVPYTNPAKNIPQRLVFCASFGNHIIFTNANIINETCNCHMTISSAKWHPFIPFKLHANIHFDNVLYTFPRAHVDAANTSSLCLFFLLLSHTEMDMMFEFLVRSWQSVKQQRMIPF